MKKKRLFVYSVDALVQEDLAYLKTLPNFSKFLEHASGCENVETIYPSVTYPVHVPFRPAVIPRRMAFSATICLKRTEKESAGPGIPV